MVCSGGIYIRLAIGERQVFCGNSEGMKLRPVTSAISYQTHAKRSSELDVRKSPQVRTPSKSIGTTSAMEVAIDC